MIPQACKRLAEVDFPIAEVSRHAAREKSIRHGHPSTLHLWWARRPLASSRAMLLALLLPDPYDPHCPEPFKEQAREALLGMQSRPSGWEHLAETDEGLRRVLLSFIGDFANWDHAASERHLATGRALVRAAYPQESPLVVDPFAGGGSIPVEALRLGCETFGSDLNPVASLILKVMLEDIPRYGSSLADDLRQAGAAIKEAAERELADLYPADSDGATPIAYLWARTVRCEAPNCGAEIPLMRSFWLCRKRNRRWALNARIDRHDGESPQVEFTIFEPEADSEVRGGTVSRARATCICCGSVLPAERVRSQLAAQRGGADPVFSKNGDRVGGARMTAVVTSHAGEPGRRYRLPTDADYAAVRQAQERAADILKTWEQRGQQGLCPLPDERISRSEIRRISVPLYGMSLWRDLFTARQQIALVELVSSALEARSTYQRASLEIALAISKQAERLSSSVSWITSTEAPRGAFSRQALGIVWDFLELVPVVGDREFPQLIEAMAQVIESFASTSPAVGQTQAADATAHPLPDHAADVWFTDPPYYDAVPYSHLSDYFFVWLKRLLSESVQSVATGEATPKSREIVVDRPHSASTSNKDALFYEREIGNAFAQGARILSDDGVGSVVFAHKQTDSWERLLSGLVDGGLTITGSWPVATERRGRLNANETAALTTSIHLICRPRRQDATVGDWADVLYELPRRVGDWMQRLQGEGIRGADLVFACVGPALEIYSQYSGVETPEGREVPLPEYLERVWEVVGREALEQVLGTAEAQARNGQVGVLEEDARLTALFLWTMQATAEIGDAEEDPQDDAAQRKTKSHSLPFDVVRRFAQPLGIHLDEWEGRITETEKGIVRLRPVRERGRQLFGEDGADSMADQIESNAEASHQLRLFPEEAPPVRGRARRRRRRVVAELDTPLSATTLDRIHAAMLLQASGRSTALRALLRAEQERGPDFLRLANALTALYPRGSDEKRLLDAMLLAVS